MAEDRAAPVPYFQLMTVVGAHRLTPRLVRVVLAGDAARLATGGLHVRVLIPRPGIAPRWPGLDAATGAAIWPTGDDAPIGRVYTLRRVDLTSNQVAIDVVQHGDGPGAAWGATARPGDIVGIAGPGGDTVPTARWHLIAGDETAAPAIARILEELPAEATAVVRIEVEDIADIPPLMSAARLDLRLLPRQGRGAGLLRSAIAEVALPEAGEDAHVWVGCERGVARCIRGDLDARCCAGMRRRVAGYWVAGRADTHGA